MPTNWAFNHIENKHSLYPGQDCVKKFCSSLKEHATNIISFEEKKMLPLTTKELKSQQDAKVCSICGKALMKKLAKNKNHRKVRKHCHCTGKYRHVVHSICHLKFNVPNEIPVVFWMIGANLIKHHCLKKKNFIVT